MEKLTINLECCLDGLADFEKRLDNAIQEGKRPNEITFADIVCSIAKNFDIDTIWESLDEFESDKDLSKVSVQELFEYLVEGFFRDV